LAFSLLLELGMTTHEALSLLSLQISEIKFFHFFEIENRPIDKEKEVGQWLEEALGKRISYQMSGALSDQKFIYPSHPSYPQKLLDLEDPPCYLAYEGCLDVFQQLSLSVVGSREPTTLSLDWMELHLSDLVAKGIVTVSGGARGVDQKAHFISLRAQRPTVMVLPTGLGQIYPREMQDVVSHICDCGGIVISELGHMNPVRKHYFEKRNRIIAALSGVTLIVEAHRRSGTSMTARLAMDLNRTLAVVPGHPLNPHWGGSLELLSSGAFPARDALDIQSLLFSSRPVLGGKH